MHRTVLCITNGPNDDSIELLRTDTWNRIHQFVVANPALKQVPMLKQLRKELQTDMLAAYQHIRTLPYDPSGASYRVDISVVAWPDNAPESMKVYVSKVTVTLIFVTKVVQGHNLTVEVEPHQEFLWNSVQGTQSTFANVTEPFLAFTCCNVPLHLYHNERKRGDSAVCVYAWHMFALSIPCSIQVPVNELRIRSESVRASSSDDKRTLPWMSPAFMGTVTTAATALLNGLLAACSGGVGAHLCCQGLRTAQWWRW